jgi:hypothetical protein
MVPRAHTFLNRHTAAALRQNSQIYNQYTAHTFPPIYVTAEQIIQDENGSTIT